MAGLGTVDLTVDELAARTGVSVRTVRYYATRGLLPPPRLRGRLGLYGPDHIARLELVRELQESGFTLTAIEGFLENLPNDAAPEDLAMLRTLLTPWMPERAEEITRAEFDRRAGRHVDDDVLDRLALLGVVERRDGDVVAVRSGLLTLGLQALDANVPVETLLAAKETVERHAGAVAEDLTRLFRDAVVQPFLDSGGTPEARAQMINALDALKPVAVQSLVIAFQQAVNRAVRESAADF